MSGRYVVVVDAGSTRIRCLVFDSKGKAVAESSTPWKYLAPEVSSPFARALDADGVWDSTERLIAECVGESNLRGRRGVAWGGSTVIRGGDSVGWEMETVGSSKSGAQT